MRWTYVFNEVLALWERVQVRSIRMMDKAERDTAQGVYDCLIMDCGELKEWHTNWLEAEQDARG